MKKFDKGYIYSALLSDLFKSLVVTGTFLFDFVSEEATIEVFIKKFIFLVVAFAVIYLCFIIYRILYYKASGYELTETEIKCNTGVLFKRRSIIEYKKIHAINKKQNIFQRVFGVAVLTVDSGSTNTAYQAEITVFEKAKTVDLLIEKLNNFKENRPQSVAETKEKPEVLLSENDSLYSFTSKRKMLYTLINIVSTAFFIGLFAVLAIVVLSVCKLVLSLDFLGSWGQYYLYAILLTVLVMLLFSIFALIASIIYSFVGYHNFTITKKGNNIQISYGLLEKHTNTFGYDRIKAVKISQGLIQRMLGFAEIKLEVIGYTNEMNSETAEIGVLVPFCKYNEVGQILGKILPDYTPDQKQTKAVSFFPFVSWFLLFFGIAFSVILAVAVVFMLTIDAATTTANIVILCILGLAFIILAFKLVGALLNYKTNGLAIDNGKITAYNGGFTKNITVFKAKNLIAVANVTTPLRKKAGITSLVMHLKTNALSNEVKVHIQKEELSQVLQNLLIL